MKENKILKWSLILSAVIIANMFFNYSLSLIFNEPKYENFCEMNQRFDYVEMTDQERKLDAKSYQECNDNFQLARENYEEKIFLSLIPIGIILLIASALIKNNSTIVSSLALTGLLDLVIASVRYWRYSDELIKVSILFIALVVIFYLIVKKFKDS